MKNIMSLLVAGSITFAACTQGIDNSKVPMPVKDSFAKDFPGSAAKWDMEKSDYEANFSKDGKTMSALYNADGNRQETETDINVSDLPATVQDYIAKNYPGKKIKEAATITKANGEVNYEAEVNDTDVLFTQDGKFIKTAKD